MTDPSESGDWPDRVWDPEGIRRRALEFLGGEALESFRLMPEADVRALAHELRVHQVELEMQNDELRRALTERDEALEQYADLYDFAPIGLVTLDVNGRIVEANLTAAALLSVYRGSLVGSNLQSFLVAESIPVFDRFRRGLAVTGAQRGCDLEARVPDGRLLVLRLEGLVYVPGSGDEGQIRASLSDVSQHREMERTLRESEQHFRSVVETAGDAIITLDQVGRVALWNRAAEAMFGYAFSEVRGASIEAIMPAGFREPHVAGVRRVVSSGVSDLVGTTAEQVAVHRDGTEFPVELTLARWTSGSQIFFTGIVRDLSERRRAQQERDALQDQLRQALKMEAIGRLAGGVAHDMNNMLTPILGFAELLLSDTSETDPRRADMEEISRAATRARDLTRQLLAFARKQTLEMRVLDLNQVVGGFEKMLGRMLRDDVSLELHLAPSLGAVEGDVGQLEQVLLNLALNAQDAMPGGGVISVATSGAEISEAGIIEVAADDAERWVPPGSYVVMTVADTGQGMEPEVLERLFEPFFTSKTIGRGTGLGLATVYGIVKQHAGEIAVRSEPGRGTTFEVYLPRAEGEPAVEHLHEAQQPVGGTETILLAEDQEQVRMFTSLALRRYGYRVLAAPDGLRALELAASHSGPLHLLLTDVLMPGLNGSDLAARIREARPDLRVLYMSGYADETLGRDGILAPDVELLQKPFSAQELAIRVRHVLNG